MPRAKTTAPTSTKPEAAAEAGEEPQIEGIPSAEAPKEQKQPTPAAVVPCVFDSEFGSLIVYAGGEKIATFALGRYETSDPKVIEALRGSELVREVGGDD